MSMRQRINVRDTQLGFRQCWRASIAGVALLVVLSGCSGSAGEQAKAPSASGRASVSSPGPAATGTASRYPVAPSASPSALPSLGSATNGKWSFVLTAVRKAGPGQLVVEGVMTPKKQSFFNDFAESGFETYLKDGAQYSNWDFSGVRLSVSGDATVYLAMRDDKGRCACTQDFVASVKAGQAKGVFVYMTSPAEVSSVNVLVPGFPTFTNIPVTS